MAESVARRIARPSGADAWLATGVIIVALVMALPLLSIIVLSWNADDNIWPHLLATVMPGYVWRTLCLLAGVGALTFVLGTATAWLVSMLDFPLRRTLQWACLLPLAMPTYISSYTYVDFFTYAGPLQSSLRASIGWATPQDYYFPEIRSLPGAILVLSMVLYPYVFMTAQASFLRQPGSQLDAARTLGKSPWGAFFTVALPQARPAIVVGVSLALMECLNDIGAVGFFGVRTLTLGIYTTWLGEGNLGGAAQLAGVLLLFVFSLLWMERQARNQQPAMPAARRMMPPPRQSLSGFRGWLATVVCLVPVFLGFILPALILSRFALRRGHVAQGFGDAISHSVALSVIATIVILMLGLVLAYGSRLRGNRLVSGVIRIASIGYAIPGTVLGIGVLVPLAAFDNSLDGFMRQHFGVSTGLLLSGTMFAIVLAYAIRFVAISFGSLDSGLDKVTPNLSAAARTLGRTRFQTVIDIHLPMLRPAVFSAALLVFVDCMKELPTTLILRPFDFDTLATLVFALASLDQLEESAAPALTIVAVGILPVILLARSLQGAERGQIAK